MFSYLKDKRDLMWTIWCIMEEVQDLNPHLQIGRDGFQYMIHEGAIDGFFIKHGIFAMERSKGGRKE